MHVRELLGRKMRSVMGLNGCGRCTKIDTDPRYAYKSDNYHTLSQPYISPLKSDIAGVHDNIRISVVTCMSRRAQSLRPTYAML